MSPATRRAAVLAALMTGGLGQPLRAQESIATCVTKSALAGLPYGVAALGTGQWRLGAQAAVGYAGLLTVQCTVNARVGARNAAGRRVLRRQVTEFQKRAKLFAYEQRIAQGDTPGSETEVGTGVLSFHRLTPADLTQEWFARLAAAPRGRRAVIAVDSVLRVRSSRRLFDDWTATYDTRIYQALVEGAETTTEASVAAEEQANDARRFAADVEARFRTEQPGAGRALQYSALLEHRRAMDANHQLRMAIEDLRSATDELSTSATRSATHRLSGTAGVRW